MRSNSIGGSPSEAYPFRSSSFLISLVVHGVAITFLGLTSPSYRPPSRPVFDELIRPNEHKITFYDLRRRDVAPAERIGRSPVPLGAEVSQQTVIAIAPRPQSRKQSIFVPVPKIELRQDVPAPDLVARIATSLPALPPPPQAQPKPAKAFVPPPINRAPKLPVQIPNVDTQAPSVVAPASPTLTSTDGISALSRLAAPRPEAPPVPAATNGTASVDVAIANLNPVKNPNPELPEGARPGEFSKAPVKGPAATGDATPSTLSVPNLRIREPENKPPPTVKVPDDKRDGKIVLYAERVRNAPHSTLSVALRPAARTIPAAVEARFRGRNVYAIVVPIENMPAYTGDWIVWFAEREQKLGETPLIYAPMPFRKIEAVDDAPANRLKQRLQVAAMVGKDGKLNAVTLLTNENLAVERAAMQDVASWEFKPATRNGVPVDVEAVIEIPFNLPSPTATSPSP